MSELLKRFATLFAMVVAVLVTACNTETPEPTINYIVSGGGSVAADADTDVDADTDSDSDVDVDTGTEPVVDDTGTEEVLVTYYYDNDTDGYGNAASSLTTSQSQPAGWVTNSTDCNDNDLLVNPDATEVCDSVDNDCNGVVDDDYAFDATNWVGDADGDGYGDVSLDELVKACNEPAGYAANATDCNDTDATVNPGADEVENDVDDDCNGTVDDVGDFCCPDGDGDGYGYDGDADGDGIVDDGEAGCTWSETATCPTGYVVDDGDCDDSNSSYNPGQFDLPADGRDSNCDGNDDT